MAARLFRSEEITTLFGAVAEKTDKGTISLRRDRVLHTDVRLSRKLIDTVRKAQASRRREDQARVEGCGFTHRSASGTGGRLVSL